MQLHFIKTTTCGHGPYWAKGLCRNCYIRTWRAANPEKANAFSHAWYVVNATPTYRSWKSMLDRCRNPRLRSWKDYGGRGITICARWRIFTNFLADMGERPEGTTIDRLDNDGNYEPGNCRWATPKEQRANQRGGKR